MTGLKMYRLIGNKLRTFHKNSSQYVQFYNPGPKFWGSLPKKFLGAKNMQNLARFRSTLKRMTKSY